MPAAIPAQKFAASVGAVLVARGKDFVTEAADRLVLTWHGIEGDCHSGATRASGSREPWYPRGTQMRNERQVTVVSADELAIVAGRMGLAELRPEWIGANLVLAGVRDLTLLPPGTLLLFQNGATLKVDAQNHPCRLAGRSIARFAGLPDTPESALLFPKHAKRLRGLTAWVEKPGTIVPGEALVVRVPEQIAYRA